MTEVYVTESNSESNTTTDTVTGNSGRTTKSKVVGEKLKRFCYTVTQTVYLEQAFGKGDLTTKDGKQKFADDFTKETGEKFDPDRIKTWLRNVTRNLIQTESRRVFVLLRRNFTTDDDPTPPPAPDISVSV